MNKLHVTQDDHGFWMLSLEKEDGTLALLAHQFSTPDKAIHIANELIQEKKVTATILIDPPKPGPEAIGAEATSAEAMGAPAVPDEYTKPAPKKAGA
jgi:hypothetical protein